MSYRTHNLQRLLPYRRYGHSRLRLKLRPSAPTQSLARGAHTVIARKEGFEEVSLDFEFVSRSQVLHLRLFSADQLLDEAERAIAGRLWEDAERFLGRAESIRKDDPVRLYLKAILQKERGRFYDAVDTLQHIIGIGYREPYVLLAMADIFQYRLGDADAAAGALAEYLLVKDDAEIRKRLELLREGITGE